MDLKSLIKQRPQLPPRILIYTIPGWGKSTLAASMPNPVFIDIEDGLSGLTVDAFPVPGKYEAIEDYIRALINEDHQYKTVVIDTLSSLEKLIFAKVCKDHNKENIEAFGYAKGYVYAMQHWNKIIDGMDKLRAKGIAPVLLAHSEIKTINDPIVDAYDKYILRLHRHPASMIMQWADNIFFGTHKTIVSKQGEGFNQKAKGIGQGERVVYTEERPAFTAKSRMNLPFEVEIPKENGWSAISQYLNNNTEERKVA
jgi:hypothetical protein